MQATPANLERENWGYVYGRVAGVEQYPTTRQEVVSRLKLDPLANFIPEGEAVYELRVTLDERDGELVWSRDKSRNIKIGNGAFCDVHVITQRKPVWRVLIGAVSDSVNSLAGN